MGPAVDLAPVVDTSRLASRATPILRPSTPLVGGRGYIAVTAARPAQPTGGNVSYGYRIFGVKLTPHRKRTPDLHFDNSAFGPDGAFGLLRSTITDAMGAGGSSDDRASSYFRIDGAKAGGWVLTLDVSTGDYGRQRDVVDVTTHSASQTITVDEAVMDGSKFILVVPPYGTTGVLVSLVNRRSHATPALARLLNRVLREQNLTLRLESDFADAVAWNDFLDQSDVDLKAIELVQNYRGADRTSFGNNSSVSQAVLSLKLADSSKGKILKKIGKARANKKPLKLAGVVGLSGAASDDDFDEQRLIYVQDGRQRTITVAQDWPAFVYALDAEGEPGFVEFMNGSMSEVKHVLSELGTNTPSGWWPNEPDMDTIGE